MAICVLVRAMLLMTAYSSVQLAAGESGVILNLHDVYATDGSVAEFHCMGYAAYNVFGIKIDNKPFPNSYTEELPKNVTFQYSKSEVNNIVSIITLNITIPAAIANNLTAVTCFFHDDESDFFDTTATLYVTANPPSSPGTPSVTVFDLTTLKISWTAPWYPADSYIVQIKNMTVGGSVTSQTINSTSLIETRDSSDGLCHSLEFTVKAVHSTLGNSFPSNGIISGFPKVLSGVGKKSINVDQLLEANKMSIRIDFTFEPPDVCSYQFLQYNFTLVNPLDGSTQAYGPTNALSHEFNNVALSPQYLLIIAVWDETGVVYFTNKTIGSDFVQDGTDSHTATNPTSSTDSGSVDIGNSSTESGVMSTTLIVSLIGGIGAAILLLVALSVILLVVFLLRTNKRQRQNVAATEEAPNGPMAITRLPQVMSTNPTYEGFSKEAVYDSITNQKDLNQLPHSSHFSNSIPKPLLGEIPPQVPPPRKMSLDSPGLKSNTQLCFSKTVCGADLATPNNECSPGFEEYVDMLSTGTRYVKSPLVSERKTMKKE